WLILVSGRPGEVYNVGGDGERTNLAVVETICDVVDQMAPKLASGQPRRSLINFVTDRPGHDLRYAIDATKLRTELRWQPLENSDSGLARTVRWYLDNRAWWEKLRAGSYKGERLGLTGGKS